MDIQKVGDISYAGFMQEFYQPGIPVIFKNASRVWKARDIFNPEWFRTYFGDRKTLVKGSSLTMRQVMDEIESSTESAPAPYPIIFNIPETLPELMEMIQPMDLNYARPNWLEKKWFKRGNWGSATELFIGGRGGKFPYLHLDYYHLHAWITQLYGEKRFTIFPKGQDHLLYPKADDPWRSDINIFQPDVHKYPKFREATPVNVVLYAGETLFIPCGTWHTAYSMTPSISVAFDQLNSKNFKAFLSDVWSFKKRESKVKAIVKTSYAWLAGQFCKLGDQV
jgi:histone arginine demethylase JMJD6